MSDQLRQRLFTELDSIRLIDPHSHIEPKSAASKTLADILGYHYYTELCHSAGMPRADIEEPGLDPKEKVRRLVERIEPLRNTIQYSWLLELARTFFDFPADEHLTHVELGIALRHGFPQDGPAQLGTAGARSHEARRGVPDQQLRRPARRLRHQALRSLPADRRSGVSPCKARSPPAACKKPRTPTFTTPNRWAMQFGSCSNISSRRAHGPARSRCPRRSNRRPVPRTRPIRRSHRC